MTHYGQHVAPPVAPWPSSAIKAPALGAPKLSQRPAATLWPSTAHPSQESRGRRGRRRGSAEAMRRHRCRRSRRRRHDAALHCFRSYTATTRHCTAIPSSITATVNFSPLRPSPSPWTPSLCTRSPSSQHHRHGMATAGAPSHLASLGHSHRGTP